VADSFDTMVSERAYKRGRTIAEAVEELRRCSETQFEGPLVEAFARSLQTLGDPRQREVVERTIH